MNLEELQAARDRERQTDKLQQLRESFYADAGEFIQQLQTERDRAAERADDPFDSPEVSQLTDEIKTAEQTVEAIYEKRVGKIVKAASFAAADLPAEADGMTKEEQRLFETLVEDIKSNRQHVLAVLDGEEPASETAEKTAAPEPDVSAADLMGAGEDADPSPGGVSGPTEPQSTSGSGPEPDHPSTSGDQPPTEPRTVDSGGPQSGGQPDSSGPEPASPARTGDALRNDGGQPTVEESGEPASGPADTSQPSVERQTVRITDDVGTFVGVDERDYDLERDDIVTLPETNASLLIERDAAEQL
ncbi:hypothetical protein GRX03_02905 [Halovenus sp. WSH3]|uniref:Gins51 C-terminal domain-containing protein n=1 Tax=Halovenus carboxidivorans TaxID=2692199 RepID=A0A6B0SXU0_9EURY|nr:hypothetical protein [Halovenus carboxidivorans]MXR50558.1 hypothetical protein [Halovenus carboxidivorans]